MSKLLTPATRQGIKAAGPAACWGHSFLYLEGQQKLSLSEEAEERAASCRRKIGDTIWHESSPTMDSAVSNKRGPLNIHSRSFIEATTWKRHRGTQNMEYISLASTCMRQLQSFLAVIICLITITSTYADNIVPAGRPSISPLTWQAHDNISTFPSQHLQSVPVPCWSYVCEVSTKLKLPIMDYIARRRRRLPQQNSSTLSSPTKAFGHYALKMKIHHRSKREARESLDLNTAYPSLSQSKTVYSLSSKAPTTAKKAWQHVLENWVASVFGGEWEFPGRTHKDESRIMVSNDAKILNAANDLKSRPWMGGLGYPFGLFSGNVNLPKTTHLPITPKSVPKVSEKAKMREDASSTMEHVSAYPLTSMLNKRNLAVSGGKSSALTGLFPSDTLDGKLLDSGSTTGSISSPIYAHKTTAMSVPLSNKSLSMIRSTEDVIAHNLSVSSMRELEFASTTASLKGSAEASTHEVLKLFKLLSSSVSRKTTVLSFKKSSSDMTLHQTNTSSELVHTSDIPSIAGLVSKVHSVAEVTQEHWATTNVSHLSIPESVNLISQLPPRSTESKDSLSPHIVHVLNFGRPTIFSLGSSVATTDQPRLVSSTVSGFHATLSSKGVLENMMELIDSLEVTPLSVSESIADLPSKVVCNGSRNDKPCNSSVVFLQGSRPAAPFKLEDGITDILCNRTAILPSIDLRSNDLVSRSVPTVHSATRPFWALSQSKDKVPLHGVSNQTAGTSKSVTRLTSSAQFTYKSGTHITSATEMPLLRGSDLTYSVYNSNSTFSGNAGVIAVTQLPHDLMSVNLSQASIPLRPTASTFQNIVAYPESWLEKLPFTTSFPTQPIPDKLAMAGSQSIHGDFPRATPERFGGSTSTEMYIRSSHQTNILKNASSLRQLILVTVGYGQQTSPMSPATEQTATALNENTISNLLSPIYENTGDVTGADSTLLNWSSVKSDSAIVSVVPNSTRSENFTSLYQAKPEFVLTQKIILVPSTSVSSLPSHLVNLPAKTQMDMQSHFSSEKTVTISSIQSTVLPVTVAGSKIPFLSFKMVSSNDSITPQTLLHMESSSKLQPHTSISVSSTDLKAFPVTHRHALESSSAAILTEPLKEAETLQSSTHPITISRDPKISLPSSLNTSVGALVPYGPATVAKTDLSKLFLNRSTVLATKASRTFVSHSAGRMQQMDAVKGSSTPLSGMESSRPAIINLLPEFKSNRSKRTLPTSHSNTLTDPANVRNSSLVFAIFLTSTAPVISGNRSLHSLNSVASGGSASRGDSPDNLMLSERPSNLNGGSGDWPSTTLTASSVKGTTASCPKCFMQIPQAATTPPVGGPDLFSTEDSSWTTKRSHAMESKLIGDWLTTTTSLPGSTELFDMPDPLQPNSTEAIDNIDITQSENVVPSGILQTISFPNITLAEKQTTYSTAQITTFSTGIIERAHPDPSIWQHDLSITPSRPSTGMSDSGKYKSSSSFSSTYTKIQHKDLDHTVLASSMRYGETTAALDSYSITGTSVDSSVEESNTNVPVQAAGQNASSVASSYVSALQFNVSTASEVSSRWKTSLPKTNISIKAETCVSDTVEKLSPTQFVLNRTKKSAAFAVPPKAQSTVVNNFLNSFTVSTGLQPYTDTLRHNYTVIAYKYNTTGVSQARHWLSTSVVPLNVMHSTGRHLQPPTAFIKKSPLVTAIPSSSLTASLGDAPMKAFIGRANSTSTVVSQHHATSPYVQINSTVMNITAIFDPLFPENGSQVAALLLDATSAHPHFHNLTMSPALLDHSNGHASLPFEHKWVSISASQNASVLSTGTVENITPSSWFSLSEPAKPLGARSSTFPLTSTTTPFSTRPVTPWASAIDHHLDMRETLPPLAHSQILEEARSMSSQFKTDPTTEPIVSSVDSFLGTKSTISKLDPFVRESKITLKFTAVSPWTSKVSKWVAPGTKAYPTLLEPLVPKSDSLFEMSTKKPSHVKSELTLAPTILPTLNTLPLRYRLTGIQYTEELQNQSAAAYRKLEHEVILTLNKMLFSRYGKRYLQTNVLHFLNGSVVVECEVEFRKDLPIPSSSDIIRTIVTEVYRKTSAFFNWSIDVHSLQSKNYTLQNLEPERLSLSFRTLRMGFVAAADFLRSTMGPLSSLQDEVVQALSKQFAISLFQFVEVRNIKGDLDSRGDLYIDTQIHADVRQILQLLKHLVNQSVDLTSLSVDGVWLDLQVFPITFQIRNRKFDIKLLDHSSTEFKNLTRDISAAVLRALKDDNLLQVVIRNILSGSVLCQGDLIFQKPAPSSQDILQALISSVGSDKVLAGSAFQVDRSTFTIGDSKPDPFFEYADFPGFAVAIIVMCGLSILFIPILVILFLKSGMLGRRSKATIQGRRDAEMGRGAVELDNRGFCSSIEQP